MATKPKTKLDQLIELFQKLSNEDKKKKVLALLDYIKDKVFFAKPTIEFINKRKEASDRFLETIYKLVMQTALESISQENSVKLKQKWDQIKKISEIEKKISSEKSKADDILKNI